MHSDPNQIDLAILEIERLKKTISRTSNHQIRSSDERALMKTVALSWFNKHREAAAMIEPALIESLNTAYTQLLEGADRLSSRNKIRQEAGKIRELLISARSSILKQGSGNTPSTSQIEYPDFSRLISDAKMQTILRRRWEETVNCMRVNANLSAMVMMGGLLEGLILARVQRMQDRSTVFKAASAPKNKDRTPLQLKEWGLQNFLDVAHELGWISQTASDLGVVIRDYRNYIHPVKEYTVGMIVLTNSDMEMCWTVFKNITVGIISI